jgi:hypothetical protein
VKVEFCLCSVIAFALVLGAPSAGRAAEARKRIVFVAAAGSHGFGNHAYKAGFILFAKLLNENAPNVEAVVVTGGWPKDASAFEGASAIVLGSDGGALPAQHTKELDALSKKGVGIACIHYTLDVPKGDVRRLMLDALGGYYEQGWSVNPTWEANFTALPDHPISRGVRPFKISDEWYYHMRFRDEMKGVTPILSAIPPDSTRKGPDGAHSGNPTVRSRLGMPEHVAWAYERPEGGRGFGFSGAHFHWNWAQDDLRKLMLNAFVWIAGAEVPPDGVPSKTPTVDDLIANQESQPPKNWKPDQLERMIEQFNRRP